MLQDFDAKFSSLLSPQCGIAGTSSIEACPRNARARIARVMTLVERERLRKEREGEGGEGRNREREREREKEREETATRIKRCFDRWINIQIEPRCCALWSEMDASEEGMERREADWKRESERAREPEMMKGDLAPISGNPFICSANGAISCKYCSEAWAFKYRLRFALVSQLQKGI